MSTRMRIRQTRTSPGVPKHDRPTDDSGVAPTEQHDRGVSLVEMLVAVTLMGTVVVAVVASVGVTVKATAYERDHAKAQQWLQAAVGVIEAVDFQSCDPLVITGANVQKAYQDAVSAKVDTNGDGVVNSADGVDTNGDGVVNSDDGARRPWEYDGDLTVQVPDVWDGSKFVPFSAQSVCYDQSRLRQQRVRLVVDHPSGVQESVEMIKVDR